VVVDDDSGELLGLDLIVSENRDEVRDMVEPVAGKWAPRSW